MYEGGDKPEAKGLAVAKGTHVHSVRTGGSKRLGLGGSVQESKVETSTGNRASDRGSVKGLRGGARVEGLRRRLGSQSAGERQGRQADPVPAVQGCFDDYPNCLEIVRELGIHAAEHRCPVRPTSLCSGAGPDPPHTICCCRRRATNPLKTSLVRPPQVPPGCTGFAAGKRLPVSDAQLGRARQRKG
jgi:hypothetical protein